MDLTDKLMERRTIRHFKKELDESLVEKVLEITNRTATSIGMQMASVIKVTDPEKKKAIAEIGGQPYIATCPVLFIFIADLYRNNEINKELNRQHDNIRDMDKFFQGFTDSVLMAGTAANAGEALGLGSVFLGSIHNDTEKICEILELPELTFPAVGLGMGVPDEEPMKKPRMSLSMRVFENTYGRFDGEYLDKLKDFDEEVSKYYDLREGGKASDKFTDQVPEKTEAAPKRRKNIFNVVKSQGFRP